MPDTSPFHRSITAAHQTLYYNNSVGRAVHPANGSSFLVSSSFFSGAPEYQPPSKVRIVSSTKTRAQIQTEKQHSDEEATFESPQAQTQPYETLPSTSKAQQFKPGCGDNIPYLQSNKTCTPSMMCIMWKSTIPCITPRPMYHYAPPPNNTCYCGRGCNSQTELKAHIDRRHADGIYECVVCQYNSDNHRHVWKHYRTQHLYIHTHICKVKGCKDGKNNKPYGNDKQHTV